MDKDFLDSPFYRLVLKTISIFNLTENEKDTIIGMNVIGMSKWLVSVLPQFTPEDVSRLSTDEFEVLKGIGYKTEEERGQAEYNAELTDKLVKDILNIVYKKKLTRDKLTKEVMELNFTDHHKRVERELERILNLLLHPKVNFLVQKRGKIQLNLESSLK